MTQGEILYARWAAAYSANNGGEQPPTWEDLGPSVQLAWIDLADQVEIYDSTEPEVGV